MGVSRQILATAELKRHHPQLTLVGSGYSYFQEWLPHVSQEVIQRGWVDSIGLGRMVLSYPELPADVLAGRTMARKRCVARLVTGTTSARKGMVSGCYPLDPFYKNVVQLGVVVTSVGHGPCSSSHVYCGFLFILFTHIR